MTRLEQIIEEVSTRQITHYEGREPRRDELLVGEILRLRNCAETDARVIRALNKAQARLVAWIERERPGTSIKAIIQG